MIGPHGVAQRVRHGALEVLGRGVVGAVEDALDVVDRHIGDGLPEQFLGRGRCVFRGTVDLELEVLGQPRHADHLQCAGHLLHAVGQRDVNLRIGVEAVGRAQLADDVLGADPQRVAHAGHDVVTGQRRVRLRRWLGRRRRRRRDLGLGHRFGRRRRAAHVGLRHDQRHESLLLVGERLG